MTRKFVLLCFLFCIAAMVPITVYADGIQFSLTEGIDNAEVKSKIESNVSRLLTEINAAQKEGRRLNLRAISAKDQAKMSLMMLWENAPFACEDDDIVEHCITTSSGYQVRNIPLQMKPKGTDEGEYQEAVISFDKAGNIESFYFAIPEKFYREVIRSNLEQTDFRRRQFLLDFVEQYLTVYYTKDLRFINCAFSEESLIIKGKVTKKENDNGSISYEIQSKEQYMRNLSQVFRRNLPIKVTVDKLDIVRHAAKPQYYGVTLRHGWSSDRYHDSGYLFMLWDFTNEKTPQIQITTWQPDMIDGKPFPEEEVYTIYNFKLP